WAQAQLERSGFREGYARLLRAAGVRRIGRLAGSGSDSVEGDETALTAGFVPADRDAPDADSIPWTEGVAILADGRHRDQAMAFLKFLADPARAGPMPTRQEPMTADDEDLLAELLGATLIDAQDELWAAWAALERVGSPPSQVRWMTEPPPWPPASI